MQPGVHYLENTLCVLQIIAYRIQYIMHVFSYWLQQLSTSYIYKTSKPNSRSS